MFTVKPDNQEVVPGATVSLRAAFTGTAPLAVQWFREETEIVTGGIYFIKKDASSSCLELHSVKPSDSSKYTCQVSNDAGRVDCTAVLSVKGARALCSCMNMNVTLTRLPSLLNVNLFSQSLPCL